MNNQVIVALFFLVVGGIVCWQASALGRWEHQARLNPRWLSPRLLTIRNWVVGLGIMGYGCTTTIRSDVLFQQTCRRAGAKWWVIGLGAMLIAVAIPGYRAAVRNEQEEAGEHASDETQAPAKKVQRQNPVYTVAQPPTPGGIAALGVLGALLLVAGISEATGIVCVLDL